MASQLQYLRGKKSIKGAVNTVSLLLIFLLSIAVFTLGSLYLELRYKHQLLVGEVTELKNSQILFMVPDEQAEVMAQWMANNPVFVQSYAERARKGEITTMPLGDGRAESVARLESVAPDNGAITINTATTQLGAVNIAKQIIQEVTANTIDERASDSDKIATNITKDRVAVDIKGETPPLAIIDADSKGAEVILDEPQLTLPVKAKRVTIAEDGVKLISLPHGGIRITTRALEE
ncbi:hypothetical protein [Shewanella sp. GutDb-MelDb]|uniref:hypothetical protein n=1 Tax=Shewanella sp. GutDb-MelDb TaxID=2058316 RepID=UPI000C7C9D95|nr:hypothetical protein [Shewanella sp. GutDb-MelDb]PKG56575.1 hypothetical protein CXF82_14275 [Shewanella sp. GutDb-MelDb]